MFEQPTPSPSARQPVHVELVAGLLLIAFGAFVLLAQFTPIGGAALVLVLGAVFLAARVLTRRPGFAVPAGVLLGVGAYVAAEELGAIAGDGGGLFFVFLGVGFLAVYAIAARPREMWPLFPAAGLLLVGMALLGLFGIEALVPVTALVAWWPLLLIGVGAWLIARASLPERIRPVVAIVGGALLAVFGILVGLGVLATLGLGITVAGPRFGMPRFLPPVVSTEEFRAPDRSSKAFAGPLRRPGSKGVGEDG
ncbi:MAG: hypothetical protein KatS3mg060_0074 [Dehalococcoidia bacterium]|nr:MAG: hypothetical protein KatS3mg060_0074 [Dehalococcoidia bacterium]